MEIASRSGPISTVKRLEGFEKRLTKDGSLHSKERLFVRSLRKRAADCLPQRRELLIEDYILLRTRCAVLI